MESRSLYRLLGFLLMLNLVYGSPEFEKEILDSFGYPSPYCFNYASLLLIKFRHMRAQTRVEVWDFMESLYKRRNRDPWFENAYFSLLYDFQKMYVDCVIGRDVGPGKR